MAIAKQIPFLALILLVGTVLRFWNLELKPLWMDEVITALFSFGRTYYDVPVEQVLPLSSYGSIFSLNPTATCAQIALTVSTQSVHPPLFFCWMHDWLNWVNELPVSWVWKLRALPAIWGVLAIAAIYLLNRLAFSTTAGLMGAALMATSPFAVYLSQEARHYTLPMLLVILALLGLYQILSDLQHHQFRPLFWLSWIAVNSLGFYVHYFFLLAFAAQIVTLLLGQVAGRSRPDQTGKVDGELRDELSNEFVEPYLVNQAQKAEVQKRQSKHQHLVVFLLPILAIALVCLTYLPWLPTFLSHIDRPETDWVKVNTPGWMAAIAPLLQVVVGWTLTTIALPIEGQPPGVAIVSGGLMAVFSIGLAGRVGLGLRQLWQQPDTRLGTQMLVTFAVTVMLEFLAIAYLLGKDFTQVPRYNFIYFPAICALIGAGLSQSSSTNSRSTNSRSANLFNRSTIIWPGWISRWGRICDRRAILVVVLVSTLSSVLVISNQVFQKPYQPDQVANTLRLEPQTPTLVTMAYSDFQDMALGLSFGLELARQQAQNPHPTEPHFAFLGQFSGYERVWQRLSLLSPPLSFPLNLWVIGPGLKQIGYRKTLSLSGSSDSAHTCRLDPAYFRRIGVPYQLYRCL